MEMITANDLYFLPRVENLESQYQKCLEEENSLLEYWNDLLQTESYFNIMFLNITADKLVVVRDLMKAIKDQIEVLKLQTLN